MERWEPIKQPYLAVRHFLADACLFFHLLISLSEEFGHIWEFGLHQLLG